METQPLDPQAVTLAKSIMHVESGGNFNAKGASGESGAAQWRPATWKDHAKEILGDPDSPMTPENQKAVLYSIIKKDKDAGLNPAQIAAKWNSGSPKNWEQKTGVNSMGVEYDVPSYVKKVTDQYHSTKETGGYKTQPVFSKPTEEKPSEEQEEGLGSKLGKRASDASKALSEAATGKINPLSGLLQTAGAAAGGVTDIAGSALSAITPDFIEKPIKGLIEKGVGKVVNTKAGQSVVGGINKFSEAHPELAGNIGAVGNIAGAVGLATGAGAAKKAVGGVIGKALGKDALSATIDIISPEIKAGTKAGASNVVKKGTKQSLIKGAIERVEDPELREAAEVIKSHSKDFDTMKTNADRVNFLRDEAIPEEAKALRAKLRQDGVQPIVTPESYKKFLSEVETAISESPSLVGDSGEYAKRLLKEFERNLPKQGDITMEHILDARQALDKAALKYKPTAFDKQGAFNDGLTAVRDAANTLLDESAPDALVKASLRRQSLLYRALKNLGPKADREVGTTRFSRFVGKYPKTTGLIKYAGKAGAPLVLGGTGAAIYNKTLGD